MASLGVRDESRGRSPQAGLADQVGKYSFEIGIVRTFRGPNIMGRYPVLETWITHAALDRPVDQIPGLLERIFAWIPSLEIAPSAPMYELLARVARELQALAGTTTDFVLAIPIPEPDTYSIGFGYEEEEVARACLEEARTLCLAAVEDQPYDAPAAIEKLRAIAYEAWPGTRVMAIVEAARKRDIPVGWVNKNARPNLLQLGHGVRQRRIMTGRTDRTPYLAAALSTDKELTKELLRSVGVPVAEGRRATDADDAWTAACALGLPVVIKPIDADYGKGVALNLNTREQVVAAFERARAFSIEVMVERFAPGNEHRLLVVDGRLVAAVRRDPPKVIGDGRLTIAQLVAEANEDPRRGPTETAPLAKIDVNHPDALAVLEEQGYRLDSVPPAGASVVIRRNSHRRNGGTTTDVTDEVHPEVAARVLEATRVVGLDLAGVDVMAQDIGRPLEEQGGVILEVNFEPELLMHLKPTFGQPRPVAEAIVNMVFPEGENGRIPIIAVTGTNGKTTTTRLVTHFVRDAGHHVGMTCTDGVYIDGRRIESGDCSGPSSAQKVLNNPAVEVAVLETARGGILRQGLGFDHGDITVVTNIGEGDHLGQRGISTVDELARVKRIAVEAVVPEGTVVLNADEPLVVGMAEHTRASLIWFSFDPDQPIIARHRASGGKAVFVRDGSLVLAEGDREHALLPIAQIPMTHEGRARFQVENALAAVSAAWAFGLSFETIRAGLTSFVGDSAQTPGRFNVLKTGEATVIFDYAHNSSALIALCEATGNFPHRRRSVVYAPGHRRDEDVIVQGQIVGNRFDRIILYEKQDDPERPHAKLNQLVREALAECNRVAEVIDIQGEFAAIDWALTNLQPGDLLVIATEDVDEALAFAQQHPALNQP